MAQVHLVEKKDRLSQSEVVKYQLLTHCFLNGIRASDADLECWSLLALRGKAELNDICKTISESKTFKTAQTVRNSLGRAERANLLMKEGKSRKKVWINPELKIQTTGNIMLDFKFLSVEKTKPNETRQGKGTDTTDGA
jgi:hypothetical protein